MIHHVTDTPRHGFSHLSRQQLSVKRHAHAGQAYPVARLVTYQPKRQLRSTGSKSQGAVGGARAGSRQEPCADSNLAGGEQLRAQAHVCRLQCCPPAESSFASQGNTVQ